ncbi:DEAD/DEAH box helicase, partial [Ectothiorhodospiraceae bacterium WFHF3C12]|nr:DEAD/DEAH box helicase [Ectothiorhodospiraceae bacterium WFHF3C12]
MSFDTLGLQAELLRAVSDQGYDSPTPIQAQAIPAVLSGSDVMASAQTGTGKTAAFVLPVLQRLGGQRPTPHRIRTLVLTPTRELAVQVMESARTYGRHLSLRSTAVYGGVNIGAQFKDLKRTPDILVATPGRLIDHMTRGTVDLSGVEMLVLDEADRMLDMGFMPAIERIVSALPKQRQTLLFSATFSATITKLARRFLNEPQVIETARPNAAADDVAQTAYLVDAHRKRELLTHLMAEHDWRQVLVFTRTKRGADRLAKQLEQEGIRSAAIHGNKTQSARTKALTAFKRRSVRALIATDVAARGIDIDDLPYVVNYDIPDNPEDYVHRIGRTGRAGQSGSAVSFVGGEEKGSFAGIRRLLDGRVQAEILAGFEPSRETRAAREAQPRRGRPS